MYFAGVIVHGHSIEYILSLRGKIQLMIDGYPFYRYSVERNKTTYNCVQNRILGFVHINWESIWNCRWIIRFLFYRCSARARVIKQRSNDTNEVFELVEVSHNHPQVMPRRGFGEAKRMLALQKSKKKQMN